MNQDENVNKKKLSAFPELCMVKWLKRIDIMLDDTSVEYKKNFLATCRKQIMDDRGISNAQEPVLSAFWKHYEKKIAKKLNLPI